MDEVESALDLVERWRERAKGLDATAAYHLRFAADELLGYIKQCLPAAT